jgi:hypothetical protein
MDRQARTGGDTVFVNSREMTGRSSNTAIVVRGEKGKDDRKQNTLAGQREAPVWGRGPHSFYTSWSFTLLFNAVNEFKSFLSFTLN